MRHKLLMTEKMESSASGPKTCNTLSEGTDRTVWAIQNTSCKCHYWVIQMFFVLALKACPHFRSFRGAIALFSISIYCWLKLLSQPEINLSFPWVCIDPQKHSLTAHQCVFILSSLLHWAFTSVNVTAGTLGLFHVLTRMESGTKKKSFPGTDGSLIGKKREKIWHKLLSGACHIIVQVLRNHPSNSCTIGVVVLKPCTSLLIKTRQWLWPSLGRGQRHGLLQLKPFLQKKKKRALIAS